MQVLAPEAVPMRTGLVQYLSGISHGEASRALARLAIFSAEAKVSDPAVEALKGRRHEDYTEILLNGLRYPTPAVANRAAHAIIKLERTDLVPELMNLLEEPDPRAPTTKVIGEKQVSIVREVVRINHHRNCVLCHAPAVPNEVAAQVTTAEAPRPDQPFGPPGSGYTQSLPTPDLLVRVDVTYLRQDYSLMQPVTNAEPWPLMQRFDYLVRTRILTGTEKVALPAPPAGYSSPYQRTALAALRASPAVTPHRRPKHGAGYWTRRNVGVGRNNK